MLLPRLLIPMARAFPVTVRAIIKYKVKYPNLYNDYKEALKDGDLQFRSIDLSELGQTEYLSLVENELALKRLPNSNREVWVTTHNGGKHVGFYEDGIWKYKSGSGNIVEETGVVIFWTEAR
jgi:hypothetical protein